MTTSEPLPDGAASHLAEAASRTADILARYLRGESVAEAIASAADELRAAASLVTGGSGEPAPTGTGRGTWGFTGKATGTARSVLPALSMHATGHLTLGARGPQSAAALNAEATRKLGGRVPEPNRLDAPASLTLSVSDAVGFTDSLQVTVARGDDAEPPSLAFLVQTLVEQFEELLDTLAGAQGGKMTAGQAAAVLGLLQLLLALLAYVRPPV